MFMNTSDYDQITLSAAAVGDAANFMLENQNVTIALHNGDPLYVELPASVVLEITYTEPGLQGDRSTGGTQARDRRDRLRDPGAAVPRAGHEGQGRHPRRRLPRSGERLNGARTKARKRALDLLYGADVPARASMRLLPPTDARNGEPARATSWAYARDIVVGMTEHGAEIDELIETYSQGWPSTGCRRSTARSCASASGRSCSTMRFLTESRFLRPSNRPRFIRQKIQLALFNGLLGRIAASFE